MTKEVIFFSPDTPISEASRTLLDKRINGCPVLDASGKLVGVLCQSDLVAQQKKLALPTVFTLLDGLVSMTSRSGLDREMEKIAALTVGQAMSTNPTTVAPDTSVEQVATLMVERGFHTIPVVQDGKVAGVIGMEDILRLVAGKG